MPPHESLVLSVALLPVLLALTAYALYPAGLWVASLFASRERVPEDPAEWPEVTVTLPVYNEERVIRERIENVLGFDYPAGRLHVIVISDASSDRTDEIAREYADRGVQLLRLPTRSGKGAAENAVAAHLRGEIVVNIDATTIVEPAGLKALVRAFGDPTVGVASGRDVSVSAIAGDRNEGEAGYVGYEMWIRQLETRTGGIVGASGCFFAIRRSLYADNFPIRYSRDFASPLMARVAGYRSVSVDGARCAVPRVPSLQREYRRKVRTMHRGIETMFHMDRLLNPMLYGWFAVKLNFHKLLRWLVPLSSLPAFVALVMLAGHMHVESYLVVGVLVPFLVGLVALRWPDGRHMPRPIALAGFLVLGSVASLEAWGQLLFDRNSDATWEPTRRTA